MAVTDFFVGEIATELIKMLTQIVRKSIVCKSSAGRLLAIVEQLYNITQEIKYSGVELPEARQFRLDQVSEEMKRGIELCQKIKNSSRWNAYKSLQYAKKLEKIEKSINRFIQGEMQLNMWADIHQINFRSMERFDRVDGSMRSLEQQVTEMRIGSGGWVQDAVQFQEQLGQSMLEGGLGGRGGPNVGVGLEVGKRKVREMLGRNDLGIVGIVGIGGSGKTTLAKEIFKDDQVKGYFDDKMLFLTVSQSPNIDNLKAKMYGFLMGNDSMTSYDRMPPWIPQYGGRTLDPVQSLIVLDDVWKLKDLEPLVNIKGPGCKILVVSRFRFPTIFQVHYEVECLRDDEAITLFCLSAFEQTSIPPEANENLVKQVVNECKGLPLALKVIGASLRDQPEMYWESARNRLQRGQPFCDSHEINLLERMKISFDHLEKKVKECFLDLGSFPEDRRIPLDILINMWVEVHDINEQDAFLILVELSNKNLVSLIKNSRVGEIYSSYYEVFVIQHDVLRDLALHLSNQGEIYERERLVMPKREAELPREWERYSDRPFNARIVSIHTGEMSEMDWPRMELPKAEVLILNFASNEYFLPPFIEDMPKLRALIVINQGTSNAVLRNFSVFNSLVNLRSLWLEKVNVPHLSNTTIPFTKMRKISLILCKINNSLDHSVVDLPQIFPCLSDLTIDHCDDLTELPSSICSMQSLKSLSITNCHGLKKLRPGLEQLTNLEILRIYACPNLRALPPGICELRCLKYLDISQCVNLAKLPDRIGNLMSLEKIDMRECSQVRYLPKSASGLQSLRSVICDEEVSPVWRDVVRARPCLNLQVVEKCFTLDWLDE
ncbi:probable disease resistance protein At4g33300 [Punica granatum]|uniref:Probable disease resistance protein At4g33300 n=1 Tax=Punica granatum TaxID=22663 RepID=A0A218X776_PUNGR|nr:probable disease resistance protein At4g33300 [Punica granatum]OWM80763.1 hypothetical protein CDL15_Pgr006793 [Punica granatum]